MSCADDRSIWRTTVDFSPMVDRSMGFAISSSQGGDAVERVCWIGGTRFLEEDAAMSEPSYGNDGNGNFHVESFGEGNLVQCWIDVTK